MRRVIVALSTALTLTSIAAPALADDHWQTLEPGLELARFTVPASSDVSASGIHILRMEPRRFELRLLNASATRDGKPLTAREWSKKHGLVAAINASMYQKDHRTSVSLMKTRTHVNNSRVSKDNAVLAFDRLDPSVPPVQIIDRTCQNFDDLRLLYGTLVQSIRMVSCDGKNVWREREEKWSVAAIGVDRAGRVLLIHVQSPYGAHDLVNALLALPIELKNAMYLEGGPQAQLFIQSGGQEIELVGSYDLGFVGNSGGLPASPIPNVLGIVRSEKIGGEAGASLGATPPASVRASEAQAAWR
jgi:hypothetical protein